MQVFKFGEQERLYLGTWVPGYLGFRVPSYCNAPYLYPGVLIRICNSGGGVFSISEVLLLKLKGDGGVVFRRVLEKASS